jgi:hypothetical protein
MWFPQTAGVDFPVPEGRIFHRIFFSSLHSMGGSPDRASPVARGPRHCAQFWAAAGGTLTVMKHPNIAVMMSGIFIILFSPAFSTIISNIHANNYYWDLRTRVKLLVSILEQSCTTIENSPLSGSQGLKRGLFIESSP